jgi:hypothetical protein
MFGMGRLSAVLSAAALLLIVVGCKNATPAPKPKHDIDIRGLWHVYFEFMQKTHKSEGVKNADELKAWAKENTTPDRLKMMAVYDLDAAFVSPRDNEPYVVRPWTKKITIHEAKGLKGKRFVAYTSGEVAEISEERFQAEASR